MRIGLHERYLWLVAGAVALSTYGIIVNQGHLDFGRLMGAYIAVFFVVSQFLAVVLFQRIPDVKTALGGLLIVLGGAVVMR
jgi:drug/metabolite transporter superfamily protein YnfA